MPAVRLRNKNVRRKRQKNERLVVNREREAVLPAVEYAADVLGGFKTLLQILPNELKVLVFDNTGRGKRPGQKVHAAISEKFWTGKSP